ncbi:MAG: hypothetical protein P1V81_06245 [Planctomycetota bacterium]|nr:hypothetical protein [Planctomycetota bacterium]
MAWAPRGFEALPLEQQRAGAARDSRERAAADAIVEHALGLVAECVREASVPGRVHGAEPRLARLGFATAGPKTADCRGIALWRRGPRNPHLLDQLLAGLAARGLAPTRPTPRLVDDSLAAVTGEQLAADGQLRGLQTAMVLAPGTDLAEAYLLQGRATGRPDGLAAPYELPDPASAATPPGSASPTFGETIRLGPGVDLHATFAALGRFAALRTRALAALGLPRPELLLVGARGGSLLASNSDLRAALERSLDGALPLGISTLREAAAIGSLG